MGASAAAAEVTAEGWQAVQCARIGAPPLRFTGQCLDEVRLEVVGIGLSFALYKRRKGQTVTVVLHRLHADGWLPDTITAPSIEAAIQAVENYCDGLTLSPISAASAASAKDLVAAVTRRGQRAAEITHYRIAAGQVLDRWVRLADSQAITREKGREGI